MGTRDTVQAYFAALKARQGWDAFLAEDLVFTSLTSPPKRVSGKAAYLEATKRFYSSIASVEVKGFIVEGERACVLTHYELRPPQGPPITSDVAEIFTVRGGKLGTLDIYFDSAPFPK